MLSYIDTRLKKSNKILFLLFGLIITIIGGLRYDTGADWLSYQYNFSEFTKYGSELFNNIKTDPLFGITTFLISTLTDKYSIYIFIIFVITFWIKYQTIQKYSNNYFYSILIYISGLFLVYDINGIRQGLALAFIFYSFKYILTDKFYLFSICVILASMIHASALIFFPMFFFRSTNISKKDYVKYSLILFPISLLLAVYIQEYGSNIINIISSDYSDKINYYSSSELYNYRISILSPSTIKKLIIWIIILILDESNNKLNNILKLTYFISIIIFLLFSFNNQISYRLSAYYASFEIILIPNILFNKPISKNRISFLISIIIIIINFYILFKTVENPSGALNNYNNILIN